MALSKKQKKKLVCVIITMLLSSELQLRKVSYKMEQEFSMMKISNLLKSDDDTFQIRFKMSKFLFTNLWKNLQRHFVNTDRISSFENVEKLMIGINFLLKGKTVRDQCEDFGRSPSSIQKARQQFVQGIIATYAHDMFSPESWPPRRKNASYTPPKDNAGVFAGCVGQIDGTHLLFNSSEIDKARFVNYHDYSSTNTLIAVDHQLRILFIYPGCEGSMHDGRVMALSNFYSKYLQTLPQGMFMLADCGYALRNHKVLTPYRNQRYHLSEFRGNNPPRNEQELFNLVHSKIRNAVERCIGVFKRKFRIFKTSSEIELDFFVKVVIAAAILYNLMLDDKDTWPEGDSSEEDGNDDDDDENNNEDRNDDTDDAAERWRAEIANALWRFRDLY